MLTLKDLPIFVSNRHPANFHRSAFVDPLAMRKKKTLRNSE